MSVLVIDVGTSGVRAAIVDRDGRMDHLIHRLTPPSTPAPGLVEFDGEVLARHATDVATEVLERHGAHVAGVGITTQRASSLIWSRATGRTLGPALGWQDLRTIGDCLTLRATHDLGFAPNQSATKMAWLLGQLGADLAGHDPDDICLGTVDSWLVWHLTAGRAHVTDHSNAAVTGLTNPSGRRWEPETLEALGLGVGQLPSIVPSIGIVGEAVVLPGAPPVAALIGDQQGSLLGQGCITPGAAKITFGTGGMLDVYTGPDAPERASRTAAGTFPIVAFSDADAIHYGTEGVMLSAGTNIEWLHRDLGLIDSPEHSHLVAASCDDTGGVVFVPALLGLGTPHWDYGARGALFGLTRGTSSAHVVRAVLEGIAHRGADLIDAARADTSLAIDAVCIDGGMSRNESFVRALARAAGLPVKVSSVTEATGLGAAFLAGVAVGQWPTLADACATVAPAWTADPDGSPSTSRALWAEAVSRTRSWIPDLSALDF